MKVNFNDFDFEGFVLKQGVFCGKNAILITPERINVKFTQNNKIFRSSVWSTDGELLSAGLKKFVNFGENQENFPTPDSLSGCTVVNKVDGSCCIVDCIEGKISMRTRGTFSYETMENSQDFEDCLNRSPKITEWLSTHQNFSLLFEITTPNLKIVLDYGTEPMFWLIGCIDKSNYSLMTQSELDSLSQELDVVRPCSYEFSSLDTLLSTIKNIDGREGCCIYCRDDQEIFKVKSESYLLKHHFKENATLENTLDLFVAYGYPNYQDFEAKLVEQFDYECFGMVRCFASTVVDAFKQVKEIEAGMQRFIEPLKSVVRRAAAEKIISSYGQTGRSSMCFSLLDGKSLSPEQMTKLMWQKLKN